MHFFNKILKSDGRISIELVHDLTCQANENWGGFLNLLPTVISYLFFPLFSPLSAFLMKQNTKKSCSILIGMKEAHCLRKKKKVGKK